MTAPITIVVTQGDPSGIGPEIVLRAVKSWNRPSDCRIVVAGYPAHFSHCGDSASSALSFRPWAEALSAPSTGGVDWARPDPEALDQIATPGVASVTGAKAAICCIEAAVEAAMQGKADAICTAPINKENLARAGFAYPGHTEMLAARCGVSRFAMLLKGGGLLVVPATIHVPLARVPALLSTEGLIDLIELTRASMPDFGIERPRIGVAGLNPHAGENGAFGREELEIISPAIDACRAMNIDAQGPLAADTIFHRALRGEFDVIVAMYHDQALIPIKTLDFFGGVNITLGLPFVRTSPDHGTAYDLAGKGVARIDSMVAALDNAYRLSKQRRARPSATTLSHE